MRSVLARTIPQRLWKQKNKNQRQSNNNDSNNDSNIDSNIDGSNNDDLVHMKHDNNPNTDKLQSSVMSSSSSRFESSRASLSHLPTNKTEKDAESRRPLSYSLPSRQSLPPPAALMHRSTTASSLVLKKQTPPFLTWTMSTTPITKHYQLNSLVLAAFDSHYQAGLYQVAYAMGLQFVETALLVIPKHGYFYSARHERQRMSSSLEAVRVCACLVDLLQSQRVTPPTPADSPQMDSHQYHFNRLQKLHQLAVDQVERASHDQYELHRAAAEKEFFSTFQDHPITVDNNNATPVTWHKKQHHDNYIINDASSTSSQEWVLLEPLLSCQESILSCCQPTQKSTASPVSMQLTTTTNLQPPRNAFSLKKTNDDAALLQNLPTSQPVPFHKSRTDTLMIASSRTPKETDDLIAFAEDDEDEDWLHVRRRQHSLSAEDILLEKALYLSGLEIVPRTTTLFRQSNIVPSDLPVPPRNVSKIDPPATLLLLEDAPTTSVDETLQESLAQKSFDSSATRLQLSTLARFYHEDFDALQRMGRVRIRQVNTYQGRIRGSTNGCTVIAPLLCIHHLLNQGDDDGLDAVTVQRVIDVETPAVLAELRNNLGLADQAFLIPSDVHDYLIQNGQLLTSQFVTVVGGNILNYEHLQSLITALQQDVGNDNNKLAATLFFHEHVVAILKIARNGTCWYDIIDSLPLKGTVQYVDESNEDFCRRWHGARRKWDDDDNNLSLDCTMVLRCFDLEALESCLKWYACSKFSQANIQYIDSYEWCDDDFFDPRVFQAFLWSSNGINSTVFSQDIADTVINACN